MALLLLAAAACTEEIPDTGTTDTGGRQATVSLSVSTAPIGAGMPGMRAIPGDIDEGTGKDYQVEDFWLMEYDDKGNIIGTPQYFESKDLTDGETAIPIILPTDDGIKYQCVVVANTHNKVFEAAIGDASTIDKLKRLGRKIEEPDDLYDKGGKDLLMNCVMPVTSVTERLDCKLYRNIAKLTLTLKNNAGSGVRLNTVQLCNVADRLCYANRLYDGAPTPSPTTSEAGFISWKAEAVVVDEGGEQTLVYYLPRNCRGNINNDLVSQKNKNAPEYATYIEIMAEDKKNGTPVRYRFYPGKNMANDFNIVPNLHYILPITIEGKGDAGTDSRVEELGNLELLESNCYIVNPLNGNARQLYSVPITRINRFWGSSDGKKAVNDDGQPMDNTISTNTVWVAEVIWQDANERLIDFCNKDGNILQEDTYESTGVGYFHFKPREGARGNVLVGVRKKSADKKYYLWSWHLWITDYNPDGYKGSWREGVYSYPVEGGGVHRYAGKGSNNVWDVKYKDKFIMDRNLGAMGASAEKLEASRGFYYQFGRKDPFPHPKTVLYDINGNPQNTFTASANDCNSIVMGKAHLYNSVFQPYTFYAGGNGEWVQDNPYISSAWNNPSWYDDGSGKSIFDPSPQGWRLPEDSGIWNIFVGNSSTPNAEGYLENGQLAFSNGWNFYMGGLSVGETVWYPASSIRNGNNGTVGVMNTGNYWSSLSSFFYTKESAFMVPGTRSSGYSVRCVKE